MPNAAQEQSLRRRILDHLFTEFDIKSRSRSHLTARPMYQVVDSTYEFLCEHTGYRGDFDPDLYDAGELPTNHPAVRSAQEWVYTIMEDPK